jgi:hypothetical protein
MTLDKTHRDVIQMHILKQETVKLSEVAYLVKKYGKPDSVRKLREKEANQAAHGLIAGCRDQYGDREVFATGRQDNDTIYSIVNNSTDAMALDGAKRQIQGNIKGCLISDKKVKWRQLYISGRISRSRYLWGLASREYVMLPDTIDTQN